MKLCKKIAIFLCSLMILGAMSLSAGAVYPEINTSERQYVFIYRPDGTLLTEGYISTLSEKSSNMVRIWLVDDKEHSILVNTANIIIIAQP